MRRQHCIGQPCVTLSDHACCRWNQQEDDSWVSRMPSSPAIMWRGTHIGDIRAAAACATNAECDEV